MNLQPTITNSQNPNTQPLFELQTMAHTEEEWAVLANEYGYGINPNKATRSELVDFIQTMIYLQKSQDLTDTDLWAVFHEQYEGFMPNHFREIWTEHRTNLRKHLLKRGVYVAKHNNRVMISDVLYKVLQEEEQHEWTD